MTHLTIIRVWLALVAALGLVQAQEAPPATVPELQKLMNIDAKDTATRLGLIEQMLNKQDVQSTLLLFLAQYGDRVRVDSVQYGSDGLQLIPGYLFVPRNLAKGVRHPGIVMVHGGFHDHFDTYYFKPVAEAISHGYVVLFPEYRGSSAYGEVHYENSYGKTDVTDVLAAADFIAKQDYVDPTRIGIIGHSRGGMTTLLAIEKAPQRFKVAVDIAGLADFVAYMSYKPEYRRQEVAKEATFAGKLPNDNLKAYMDISPVNHVEAIQTPLLVLANSFDQTVPFELHSGRMIELLKAHGKVYDSHVYTNAPGGHMFPFGDTEQAQDCWRRAFEWVGKYLKP